MRRGAAALVRIAMQEATARATADEVARRSFGRLVAILAARGNDIAAAEDALADAFAAALVAWPRDGVPRNPEAWLLTAARRRAIDEARRTKAAVRMQPHVAFLHAEMTGQDTVPDRRLELMFACAHPAIDAAMRAPLILQTILGFDAAAIASVFLVSPATMAQRLVRAKTKIRLAGIPFAIPAAHERAARLDAVLAAIYACFAEGWSDPVGTEPRRRGLAGEAIWLGRLVATSLPEDPEAAGLLALMLHAEARRAARRTPDGRFVPLAEQDTKLWDRAMTEEAEHILHEAARHGRPGRYQIEAAIQSAHAMRRNGDRPDWTAIGDLYKALQAITQSPVVALNHAVALAEMRGPDEALTALDALAEDPRLADYQPYWATRADLLARANRLHDARAAYRRAIGLEADDAIRTFLQDRLAALACHGTTCEKGA